MRPLSEVLGSIRPPIFYPLNINEIGQFILEGYGFGNFRDRLWKILKKQRLRENIHVFYIILKKLGSEYAQEEIKSPYHFSLKIEGIDVEVGFSEWDQRFYIILPRHLNKASSQKLIGPISRVLSRGYCPEIRAAEGGTMFSWYRI